MAENPSNRLKSVEFGTFDEYKVNFDGNKQTILFAWGASRPPKLLGGRFVGGGGGVSEPPSKSRGL